MGGDPLLLAFIVVIVGGLGSLARHHRRRAADRPLRRPRLGVPAGLLRPSPRRSRRSSPRCSSPSCWSSARRACSGGARAVKPLALHLAVLAALARSACAAAPTTPPTSPASWCSRSTPSATTSPSATPACSRSATPSSSPPASTPPASAPPLAGWTAAPGLLAGLAAGGAAACLTGLLALRTTGVAFMIVTLMFAQAGYLTVLYFGAVTRGDEGFVLPAAARSLGPLDLAARRPPLRSSPSRSSPPRCSRSLALVRSPTGRVLVAIRENPERTRMLGYDPFRYRLLALTLSGLSPAPPAPPTRCSSATPAPPSPRSSTRSCRCSGCCSAAPAPSSARSSAPR